MKISRIILLALGIALGKSVEENGDGKVSHDASDVQKLNELRRAILDAQNLISSLSSEEISKNLENQIESLQKDGIIDQVVNTAAEIVKEGKSEDELIDELVTLKKIGSFGNFDQITIERDHEGSMIITKTQRVSENEKAENDGKAHAGNALPRPILKSADFSSADEEKPKSKESNESEKKEEETEKGGFLHNEQLITICLAALGVTSTGLLMWIAIQHLYGIYTDFKKTMAPVGYRESSYGDEFDCPEVCSVMSARMADRPPSYQHSQHHFQRENSYPAEAQFSPPRPPEPAPPSPGCAGPSTSAYGNPHHRRQRSQEEVLPPLPDEQDSEWESDDFQITMPNSLNEATSRPSRIPALRALNDQEEPVARHLQRRFASRRRLERFRRYRRQTQGGRSQSLAVASTDCQRGQISPEDDLERYSNASQEEFRHHEREQDFLQDFESAPELAELEFIHRLIRETGASPKRATSFAHYVDRKIANDGSIVQVINVQIELDKYSATSTPSYSPKEPKIKEVFSE